MQEKIFKARKVGDFEDIAKGLMIESYILFACYFVWLSCVGSSSTIILLISELKLGSLKGMKLLLDLMSTRPSASGAPVQLLRLPLTTPPCRINLMEELAVLRWSHLRSIALVSKTPVTVITS